MCAALEFNNYTKDFPILGEKADTLREKSATGPRLQGCGGTFSRASQKFQASSLGNHGDVTSTGASQNEGKTKIAWLLDGSESQVPVAN
jgi:hypothetical protein